LNCIGLATWKLSHPGCSGRNLRPNNRMNP